MDDIAAIIVATVILNNIPLLIYQVKKKTTTETNISFLGDKLLWVFRFSKSILTAN